MRLVQANIPQDAKWDPELRPNWFRRHLELSSRPWSQQPRAIIWPESAVPFQLDREALVRELVGRVAPPGGYVITGGDRVDLMADPPTANNSLFALDSHGAIVAR